MPTASQSPLIEDGDTLTGPGRRICWRTYPDRPCRSVPKLNHRITAASSSSYTSFADEHVHAAELVITSRLGSATLVQSVPSRTQSRSEADLPSRSSFPGPHTRLGWYSRTHLLRLYLEDEATSAAGLTVPELGQAGVTDPHTSRRLTRQGGMTHLRCCQMCWG